MNKPYRKLDKDNAVMLLVDHQAGLLSLVRDIDPDKFRNNVLATADLAKYLQLPSILTTRFEQRPNCPLMPELKALFPDAPYIARPGQINRGLFSVGLSNALAFRRLRTRRATLSRLAVSTRSATQCAAF